MSPQAPAQPRCYEAAGLAILTGTLVVATGCNPLRSPADAGREGHTTMSENTTAVPLPSFSDPPPCEHTNNCETGYCAAPYDAGAIAPVGAAACVPDCIAPASTHLFCMDDAACCHAVRCRQNGLCVPEEGAPTSASSTTDSTEGDSTKGD
ncbi:MAG: hypothetical protein V3V08_17035 [Nannocystaceae bacterium]